jgi:transcriptional regulator with GAF, ATPase, and Fis domain
LYYRLGVFPVEVPPLRRRGDDVVMLAVHILEQVCRDFGRECPNLTQKQVDALKRYSWPGNIRELKNVIERAVILSDGKHLRLDLSLTEAGLQPPASDDHPSDISSERTYLTDEQMKSRVRANLVAALEAANWRISGDGGAAELLGIKPSTLTDRMRSMQINKPAADSRSTRSV